MTKENQEEAIDPLFVLSASFLVLFIGISVWNNMITDRPVEIPINSPIMVALIFLLGMGVRNQIEKLKKRRQQSHT